MPGGHDRFAAFVLLALGLGCNGPAGAGDETDTAATTASTATEGEAGTTSSEPSSDGDPELPDADTNDDGTGDGTGDETGETDGSTDGGPGFDARAFDLDLDGVPDTDLVIAPCADDPASTCLAVDSDVTATSSVSLWTGTPECNGVVHGRTLAVLGDHGGSSLAEVHAAACASDGAATPPTVAVVDVDAASVLARATAPAAQVYAWVDAARGPDERLYSVLAPSYGDGDNPDGNWGVVCMHRPDLPADPACGDGFASVVLSPPTGSFREVGGTLHDVDEDGWDDLHLSYHRTIHTVSLGTLANVASTTFDVAAAEEPGSPAWFHSGRNYGTHVSFDSAEGTRRLIIVGGAPVGTFGDDLCNVSRFVAMLDAPAGQPAARALAWADYFGFSSTIFSTYGAQFVGNPMADVARLADVVDGCIHRFADSRTTVDGEDTLLLNVFSMQAPVDYCLDEQFALYQPPTWTDDKADAWYGCFGQNVAASGTWGMQVRRQSDGTSVTGCGETYVWGWSDRLHPDGEALYLVEPLPGVGAFDLSDRESTALDVRALVDGLWVSRGLAPAVGRPRIVQTSVGGPVGLGSFSFVAGLSLDDRDDDGLDDVELEDGTWFGWDFATASFVTK